MLYLVFWGLAGVGLGNLLPWIDSQLLRKTQSALLHAVGWIDVVRSIGAFVGIAFAIVSQTSFHKLWVFQLAPKKTEANDTLFHSAVFPGKQQCNSPSPSLSPILSSGIFWTAQLLV
jgi:hypothetical protein